MERDNNLSNLPADSLGRFNKLWAALGGGALSPVRIQTLGTVALALTGDEVDELVAMIREAVEAGS